MKKKLASLVWLWLLLIPAAMADNSLNLSTESPDMPAMEHTVEHIEITLQKGLLPGLLLMNQALSMEEAVNIGLKNNLDIQTEASETGIQRAMLRQAQAKGWPLFFLGSETFLHTRNNQTLMTPDMMMNTGSSTLFEDLNASVRMPLFTGGRIRAGIRAARFALEDSQAKVQQAMADAAFAIRQAYLAALLSQQEHLVHQDHLALQKRLLRNAEARYRAGQGLRADVLRVRTEIADAGQMLNEEHRQLNNALYDLKAAMGLDLASELSISDQLSLRLWRGRDLADLVQQTINQHPHVVAAQKSLQEAEAKLRLARSQYLPQVYGQITGNLRINPDPPMLGNGVIGMMTASLPVFDCSRGAEIARAHAAVQQARISLRAIQLDLAKQVAQAWNALQFAKENVTLADAAVSQAEEDFRLIQRRYEVGRAIVVEVQDAALQLRQAQLNRVRTVYTHEMARANLIHAVGEVTMP